MATTATGDKVAFTCVWCGKKVTLLVTASGDELPDAREFLAEHSECLRRMPPTPDDPNTIVLPA